MYASSVALLAVLAVPALIAFTAVAAAGTVAGAMGLWPDGAGAGPISG